MERTSPGGWRGTTPPLAWRVAALSDGVPGFGVYSGGNTALSHRRLVYDAFGRLVRVAAVEGMDETDVAVYRYNGLNMRLMWQDDADAVSTLESGERFYVMHDERWRAGVAWNCPPHVPRKSALRLPCSVNPPGCGVVDCICGTFTPHTRRASAELHGCRVATSVARERRPYHTWTVRHARTAPPCHASLSRGRAPEWSVDPRIAKRRHGRTLPGRSCHR